MKVLIVNNHPLYRDGLKSHLRKIRKDLDIIELDSYDDAFGTLDSNPEINFTIIDMHSKDMDWREGVDRILQKSPEMRIILLSESSDPEDIILAYRKHITAFVPSNTSITTLLSTLKFVLDGESYYPPFILASVISGDFGRSSAFEPPLEYRNLLTNKQRVVLSHLSKGLSNKQIANAMDVSEATIKLHMNALLRALGVTNRTHALIKAQSMGMVRMDYAEA